jgi:pimeloyl-ACP methyl ester carboxylesterase
MRYFSSSKQTTSHFLAYNVAGEGKPLVLVHGFCESHQIWQNILPALTEKYLVIAVDLGGFGGSADLLPHPTTTESLAEQIKDLLWHLGIDQAVWIGHSLGGYVSLAFAEKYPAQVKGLGLIHSTALPDSEDKKKVRQKVIDFVEKNGVKPFIDDFVEPLFYYKRHPELQASIHTVQQIAVQTPLKTVVEVTKAMRDRPDRTHVLTQAKYPVLLAIGREDGAVPFETYIPQLTLASDTLVHIWDETAHMGMYERPEETRKLLRYFADYCYR